MTKLANYKISIEIEKLKIYVEGAREIVPELANNVANQIATVFQPARLVDGDTGKSSEDTNQVITVTTPIQARKSRKRVVGKLDSTANGSSVNWTHDAGKWGTPAQGWTQWKRIMWLLLVTEVEAGQSSGLSLEQITDTFNNKFKDAGLIVKGNIRRDLSGQPDNFGSIDGRWFLKQGGKNEAARLVEEAKGVKSV